MFYADDGLGAGSLEEVLNFWKNLQAHGPLLGCFPNATKTWLITKPQFEARAKELFPDLNVTVHGHSYLGSFIGTELSTKKFAEELVNEWKKDIGALVHIAKHDPQLAYSAYVFGTSKRWKFVCRTTPHITEAMQKLKALSEKIIFQQQWALNHVLKK